MCAPLHINGIHLPMERFIGDGKDLPDLIVHGALRICTFAAEDSGLRVVMRKQIARGKDIRTLRVRRSLPIGSQLREEIIVVCPALRTVKEIVKELVGAVIVPPEYREIVLHFSLSPLQSITLPALP